MSGDVRAYLYLNTMLLRLVKLTNERTKAIVTTGTVAASLVDRATSATISGSAIALSYDGAGGDWSGVFPSDVGVAVDQAIDVIATIDGGSALARGRIRIRCKVQERDET